jgi:hypothetical protein
MVFPDKVVNQSRKEQPEHIEHDLGEIDVVGNNSDSLHGASPS